MDIEGHQLAEPFTRNVQPLFDELKLGVTLPRVSIKLGSTNSTDGYDVSLEKANLPFDQMLGNLLHELGHVVQCVNLPRSEWHTLTRRTVMRQGSLVEESVPEWDARVYWMRRENTLNRDYNHHLYRNEMIRYEQDAYLKAMPLWALVATHVVVRGYSLDACANRFRDLFVSLCATKHSGKSG